MQSYQYRSHNQRQNRQSCHFTLREKINLYPCNFILSQIQQQVAIHNMIISGYSIHINENINVRSTHYLFLFSFSLSSILSNQYYY